MRSDLPVPSTLNFNERTFVFAFLREGDARRAAAALGISEHEAEDFGKRMMRTPGVKQAIEAEQKRVAAKYAVTAENVIGEMMKIAKANIADYTVMDENGNRTVDLSDSTYDELAAIAEITTEVRIEGKGKDAVPVKATKIKLHSKMDALRAVGTNLGLLKNQTEVTGANGGPIEIKGGGVSGLLIAIQQRNMRDVTPKVIEIDATPDDTDSERT